MFRKGVKKSCEPKIWTYLVSKNFVTKIPNKSCGHDYIRVPPVLMQFCLKRFPRPFRKWKYFFLESTLCGPPTSHFGFCRWCGVAGSERVPPAQKGWYFAVKKSQFWDQTFDLDQTIVQLGLGLSWTQSRNILSFTGKNTSVTNIILL